MIEAEIKFAADHSVIRPRLIELNAKKQRFEINHDYYLSHAHQDFKKTDEALRIRKNNDKVEITYKGPKFNTKSKSRKEINLDVNNFNTALELFTSLGYFVAGEVFKEREIWSLNEITITLDNVKNLGEFVELEIMIDSDATLEETLEIQFQLVQDLGLDPSNQITLSYLELLELQ